VRVAGASSAATSLIKEYQTLSIPKMQEETRGEMDVVSTQKRLNEEDVCQGLSLEGWLYVVGIGRRSPTCSCGFDWIY
jgi:hypothetical protein